MWLRGGGGGGGGGGGCVLHCQHFAASFGQVVPTAFFRFDRFILSVWSDKYVQQSNGHTFKLQMWHCILGCNSGPYLVASIRTTLLLRSFMVDAI